MSSGFNRARDNKHIIIGQKNTLTSATLSAAHVACASVARVHIDVIVVSVDAVVDDDNDDDDDDDDASVDGARKSSGDTSNQTRSAIRAPRRMALCME